MKPNTANVDTSNGMITENVFEELECRFFEALLDLEMNDDNHAGDRAHCVETFHGQIREAFRRSLAGARLLPGIISICADCKKIKNSAGQWIRLEQFIYEHSNVEFSHGYCAQCAEAIFLKYGLKHESCRT